MNEDVRLHIERKRKERDLEQEVAHTLTSMGKSKIERESLMRYVVKEVKEIYGYDDAAATVYAQRFLPPED